MRTTEKEWAHAGLKCMVLTHQTLYHRCGYAEVPKGHLLHGKHYDEVPAAWHDAVNGGLTFSGKIGDTWFVGFDCAHCWDAPDVSLIADEAARRSFIERYGYMLDPENHVWTLEEVERQTNALADLIGGGDQ